MTTLSVRSVFTMAVMAAGLLTLAAEVNAQGPGHGRGRHGMDPSHLADMTVIHALLDHRDTIRRTVEQLPNGVRTVTESDNVEVVAWIQEHVEAMQGRIEERRPIRMRDPLFRALFGQAQDITMTVTLTEKGVDVTETSDDPWTAKLIQAHAEVVSKFIKNGYPEMRKNHPVPVQAPRR